MPSDEYLDREEVEFVSGFDALMDAAHYNRLSRQEWETAAQEEFTVRQGQDPGKGQTSQTTAQSGASAGSRRPCATHSQKSPHKGWSCEPRSGAAQILPWVAIVMYRGCLSLVTDLAVILHNRERCWHDDLISAGVPAAVSVAHMKLHWPLHETRTDRQARSPLKPVELCG